MIKLLILWSLLFSVGCSQVQNVGVTENYTLASQRKLVKNLDIQQRTSGRFELCSPTGVWKCKKITEKTVVTSSDRGWSIQVGAYKTEGAVESALDALTSMGVGYTQHNIDDLTLVRVTGFLTKEDALRDLSNYDESFKNSFVLKVN